MKIGILGIGKMGEAMAMGLKTQAFELQGTCRDLEKAQEKTARLGFSVHSSNQKLVEWADVVILSVKPQMAEALLADLKPFFNAQKILLSVCASVSLASLRRMLDPQCSVVRVMPN